MLINPGAMRRSVRAWCVRGLRSIPTRDAIVSHARGCQRAVNAMLRSSSGVPIWGNTREQHGAPQRLYTLMIILFRTLS